MIEAELQRLAEIINGMSDKQASVSFDYWQVIGAVAAGILINGLTGLVAYFIKNSNERRQKLRDSRKRLYRALLELKSFLLEVPDFASTANGEETWKRNSERHNAICAKINAAVNSGNDAEYAKVVSEKLYVPYRDTDSLARVLNKVIRSLEPQVLSVTERAFDEHREGRKRPRR